MLDIICTKIEKTHVFLFIKLYKTVLNVFKSDYLGLMSLKKVRSRGVSHETQTRTNEAKTPVLQHTLTRINVY